MFLVVFWSNFGFVAVAANTPPTIGAIPNQTVFEDHPTDAYQLVLNDAETPELSLQLSGTSSDVSVVPTENIFFGTANGHWFVTVTPAFGVPSGSSTISVSVSDGTSSASTSFLFTVNPPPVGAARFVTSLPITIPDGTASPYPSQITVSGMPGVITNLNLTLSKFSHQRVQDVNMLLVSPSGRGVVVFSHISGGNRSASNVTVHLTDTSLYPLPDNFDLWSEPLTPTAYSPPVSFPGSAPAGPYAPVAFSSFNGLSANGTWSLYVYDDTVGATGSITGGWSMTIATDGSNGPQISSIPNQAIVEGGTSGPIPFTLSDPDTPLDSLILSTNSSNPTLVPFSNIVLGGSGSNRTVTVTPAPGQTRTATITVTVSDGTNSASASFVLTVSAPATQVRVETAPNGTGQVVPAQNVIIGHAITVYAIARDAGGNFVTNLPADSWSLVNVTGGVVGSDLVAAADNKSATFAAHLGGSAAIQASSGTLTAVASGTLTVLTNAPPTIATIPNKTTLVGTPVGPFPITINDAETPTGSLQLSGSSSDQTLVPNGNILLYNLGAQSVTVTPAPGQTGSATITVTVSDGVNNTSTNFVLTVNPPNAQTAIFAYTNALTIPNKSVANVYPSTNHVTGLPGLTTKVALLLTNVTHTSTHDLEMLLVGPGGQKAVLFSHAWGVGASHLTVGLDDAAFYPMAPTPFPLLTGTYQPTDFGHDPFPAPAPGETYSNKLAAFNGTSPVGDWLLYVMNDPTGGGTGSIGGWSLAITTDTPDTAPVIDGLADQSTTVNAPLVVNFTVSDAETPATDLVLATSSSNPGLVPDTNVVLGGSVTNRTLTLTPLNNQVGTTTIAVTVSDGVLMATNSFVLMVNQATPVITWSAPADIIYGTPLSDAQLNAIANVPGTFEYIPASGAVLDAGSNQALNVMFVPADTTSYNNAHATVLINVAQAAPLITWSNPADIIYGTPLSGTQLNATANVPGSFEYNPPPGTILGAGSLKALNATFTPTDTANYSAAGATVYITNVFKATPAITWTNPADMAYGTPLSEVQLNATASVPGIFSYSPGSGTVLNLGTNQPLTVFFIPTDWADYDLVNATVFVNVVATSGPPTILSLAGAGTTNVLITWTAISNVTYRVQYASDLVPSSTQPGPLVTTGTTWSVLVPDVTATNGIASAVDNPDGAGQRFYRIQVLP